MALMPPGPLLQTPCVTWIRVKLFWRMLGETFMEIILVRLEYYNHCEHYLIIIDNILKVNVILCRGRTGLAGVLCQRAVSTATFLKNLGGDIRKQKQII